MLFTLSNCHGIEVMLLSIIKGIAIRVLDLMRYSILTENIQERNETLTASRLAISIWVLLINFELKSWHTTEYNGTGAILDNKNYSWLCFNMFFRD